METMGQTVDTKLTRLIQLWPQLSESKKLELLNVAAFAAVRSWTIVTELFTSLVIIGG